MSSTLSHRFILVALSLLVLSSIVVREVDAGIGGILGLGNKGFGGKKTSEMLVAASILASLISKHRDSQQNKQRSPSPMQVPVPMPSPQGYGGYGAASTMYGGGYGGYGLGSSLYGGYPGVAAAAPYGMASPYGGGYGGYAAPQY